MKATKQIVTITYAIIFITILLAGSATAITGNAVPDQTPYVGVIVLFSDIAKTQPIGYCTGFLVSPTVIVTAGHSLVNTAAVSVCFDQGPISYTIENDQIIYQGTQIIYDGTPIQYPGYVPTLAGNKEYSTSDIGLIVLDQPVAEITEFANLPTAGFADTFAARTPLTVVGYGMQTQIQPRNNGPQNSWIGTVSRNSAQVDLVPANFQGSELYLKLTANSAQDKGGIAYGDSGGPVLYSDNGVDIVVGVNAFVSSANCYGVSYHARVDNSQVLAFIHSYLT